MAKMSREDLATIVAEQMPGYVLAEEPADADAAFRAHAEPEADTPDLTSLSRKYLGDASDWAVETGSIGSSDADAAGNPGSDEGGEDTMAVVYPRNAQDASSYDAGPKTIVVSAADRKIISAQG